MSIKSILQIILFLLIIIIIGGIYLLYFYTGPLKNQEISEKLLEIDQVNKNSNLSSNQEVLEEIDINKKNILKNTEKKSKKTLDENSQAKSQQNNKINVIDKGDDKLENLTKNIEYVTSNNNGDVFKIFAEFGKTNIIDTNILDLENVNGTITSEIRPQIYISSKYAEYNYSNQNSKFYNNVIINYDNKIITCDNLDLNMTENIAVGYDNVIIKDSNSIMKAQNITLNIITKDISINSKNKIKIISN